VFYKLEVKIKKENGYITNVLVNKKVEKILK